ncbi:MAG TPA: hypothetical protein VEI74_08450 [Candidatus Methylomirabilis sp.]|nr:hypothetical protein [Candidatus Methylomirabilis sp.]
MRSIRNRAHTVPYFVSTIIPTSFKNGVGSTPLTLTMTENDSSTNTDLKRFSPSLRPGYKWKNNITLELEIGAEYTDTTGPTTQDSFRRHYWSLGYRWDF